MKRKVTGVIKKIDGSPLITDISFHLQGSYEDIDIYPTQSVRIKTRLDGSFEAELWCNEGGYESSFYKCDIGRDSFCFTVPLGTEDIELSTLRQSGVQPFPSPVPTKYERRELFVPGSGQTVFTLAEAPHYPQMSRVWLNGLKYSYVTDYMIDDVLLTWLSAIRLENTDYLEVLY